MSTSLKQANYIFLYGPSGSGKSSLGPRLAQALNLPFFDLDAEIVSQSGKTIRDIFAEEGESGFRRCERQAFTTCLQHGRCVMALGGGALLDPEMRLLAESAGQVLFLTADASVLQARLKDSTELRPLLHQADGVEAAIQPAVITQSEVRAKPEVKNQIEVEKFQELLDRRREHYASFPLRLDTSHLDLTSLVWQAQISLGLFRVSGMGQDYPVIVRDGILSQIGQYIHQSGFQGRTSSGKWAVVADSQAAKYHLEAVLASMRQAGFQAEPVLVPSGEAHKTLATVNQLWEAFIKMDLDRNGGVLALGGGVTGDLAGFAAATYLRGVRWVVLPTTLLSMVDASLGGKTGADLPAGKNLIGAFHPPALVLADPTVLHTLPPEELRSGMAEVVKHGVISDPILYALCASGKQTIEHDLERVVRRGVAVKVAVIQEDPYEKGLRATLNLGHTLGHAVEKVSNYQVRHGEAVAMGMAAAARLSERLGFAEKGLAENITDTLSSLGLPTVLPKALAPDHLLEAMRLDKKRAGGRLRFVLPLRIGEVRWGVEIDHPEWIFS
jgi:shikimate kinase / 3-dehydroquinate synthase